MTPGAEKRHAGWIAALLVLCSTTQAPGQGVSPPVPSGSSLSGDTVVLSPFVVVTSEDVGYQGANTTSGSRLNTSLKDTAAAVYVFTDEFLSDFGLNTFTEMAAYAPNLQLDFADATDTANSADQGQSDNLNQRFRVRGQAASHSVDYFSTSIPVDGYNRARFEVASGPNSILFGLGSAGGLANTTTKQADARRTFGSVRYQFGSWSFNRAELDHNQVLIRDRVALRLMGLWQEADGWRNYDFDDIRRGTVAFAATPWKSGVLNLSYETGHHNDAITRPSNGFDMLRLWSLTGRRILDANNYVPVDSASGLNRSTNVRNIWITGDGVTPSSILVSNANFRRILESQYEDINLPSLQKAGATLLPRDQDPYEYSAFGPGAKKRTDFFRQSISFDQKLGNDGAIQVAYRKEKTRPVAWNVLGNGISLYGDPNSVMPNPNGTATSVPNPNAGRLYMEATWSKDYGLNDIEGARVIGSWKINRNRWWGSHAFTGLFEKDKNTAESYPAFEILVDENNVPISNAASPENANNRLIRRRYVTVGQFDTYYAGNVEEPVSFVSGGKTYHPAYINNNTNRTRVSKNTKTFMLATQSKFWRDKIVLTAGLRRDTHEVNQYAPGRFSPTDPRVQSGQVIANSLTFTNQIAKIDTYHPHTVSLGGVFHVTNFLSVFYNRSSSFGDPDSIRFLLPDLTLPPPPSGVTHDYGVMLSLLDGRVFLRATSFHTNEEKRISSQLAPANFGNRSNFIFDALLANGRITKAEHDAEYFGNTSQITSVADVKNDGYELSLSLNPSKRFTAMLNFSTTNVDRSNIAPEYDVWRARVDALWTRNPANGALVTESGETVKQHEDAITQYIQDTRAALSFNWGERKYKANATARYTFTAGRLAGAFIGAGTRWAAKPNVGRIITARTATGSPVYGNSVKGSEDFNVDAFAGYRTKMKALGRDRRLLFQLNVYNVTDEDVFEPLRYNANFSGYGRGLLRSPRSFRLTTTLEY